MQWLQVRGDVLGEDCVQKLQQVYALRLREVVLFLEHVLDIRVQGAAILVFRRVPLRDILVEEVAELDLRFVSRLQSVRLSVPVRDQFLASFVRVTHALEGRALGHVGLPVYVRVAVSAPLVAEPEEKWLLDAASDDVGHHVAHLQLRAQSVHEGDDVGIVGDPGAAVPT